MAFTFGFYNAKDVLEKTPEGKTELVPDRRYDAVQISQIFDGIISDGVYATYKKAMILKSSGDTNYIVVQPGRAWFDHTWNYVDTEMLMEAPASDTTYDRYDAVVLDIQSDMDHRENAIIWVQGTPSQDPQRPEMIKDYEHHQYPLGYILRPANSETISQAQITNTVGTEECPFVTGIIETIKTDDLIMQWEAQFEEFMSNQKIEIVEWFNEIKGLLSGDVAANLAEKLIENAESEFNHYYGLINSTTTINGDGSHIVVSSDEGSIDITFDESGDLSKTTVREFISPNEGLWNYEKSTVIENNDEGATIITEKYSKKLKE